MTNFRDIEGLLDERTLRFLGVGGPRASYADWRELD